MFASLLFFQLEKAITVPDRSEVPFTARFTLFHYWQENYESEDVTHVRVGPNLQALDRALCPISTANRQTTAV